MRARLLPLLALFLVCLLPGISHAEAPRFAHGFVIYKKVPSDQPVHYGGTLFISCNPGPTWLEYDIGQPKPFFLARDLFVTEIKFGALFEADFTTDKHVEFCKGIQSQLNTAAKQSPGMATAAKAVVAAIQAEVDRFEKGYVRIKGAWVDRTEYDAKIAAAEKDRMAAIAAQKAEDEAIRSNMEKAAVANKIRQDNLTHEYAGTAARYLATQANFETFVVEAMNVAKTGGALPIPIGTDFPGLIELPQYKDASPMLWQIGQGGSETAGAMICAFNDRAQLTAADIVFFVISDPAKHTLINDQEIQGLKKLLSKFDWQVLDGLPDVLAATRIKAVLKDKVESTKLTVTRLTLPKYTVDYNIDFPVEYIPTNQPQSPPMQQQFVLLQIRPIP
jgi:multidrug efflux pump subunit AcrA (membrane-fusion protein)